ncbi:MAG: helix-turn-helix domain-containing protein [Erysipelotrichaceae bacterium]|nr:helix-turn-helix domain-containing protein [Erysipelotrichaceae bacterium]
MEKIGLLLKQRREELGLSIEEVSHRTRLTIKYIKAIEEGDISYFKDDLSYLRFFLRSYCETIDLDFCELKDLLNESINDYTASFSIDMMERHQAIEKNIRKRSNAITNEKKHADKEKKHRRWSIDLSLVSFIGIGVIVLAGILFTAIFIVKSGMLSSSDTPEVPSVETIENEHQENNSVNEDPQQVAESTQPAEEEKKEEAAFAVEKVSDREYRLKNVKEDEEVQFEIHFGSSSAFRVLVDGVQLSEPVSKIYPYNQSLTVKQTLKKGMRISLAFGFMQNNRVQVNGIEVEIDPAYKKLAGSVVLDFVVEGD